MARFIHTAAMPAAAESPRKLTIDRDAFTRRLIFVRERLGMNKKDFGESIGLSKQNYGAVERGDRMLTPDQIYALFLVYQVPMEYLTLGIEKDLPDRFR